MNYHHRIPMLRHYPWIIDNLVKTLILILWFQQLFDALIFLLFILFPVSVRFIIQGLYS